MCSGVDSAQCPFDLSSTGSRYIVETAGGHDAIHDNEAAKFSHQSMHALNRRACSLSSENNVRVDVWAVVLTEPPTARLRYRYRHELLGTMESSILASDPSASDLAWDWYRYPLVAGTQCD